MKPTWADILPRVSEPTEFKLAGEDPRDADEEVATTDWPLPPVKPWAPVMPRPVSMWTQIKESKLLGRLR